eukprot:199483_1
MPLLLLLLLAPSLIMAVYLMPVMPTIQNASHQIYSFPNPNYTFNTMHLVDCNAANCVIQCMELNACASMTIQAVQIDNLQIFCTSYNSCSNIKLNAMNQTKVNINCFYSHSCIHSNLFVSNSYLQLQCNREHSCQDTTVLIHKPLLNALDISCNTHASCGNLAIQTMDTIAFAWSDINWFNLSTFTEHTNIILRCDRDGLYTTNVLYSEEEQRMQCAQDVICCPYNYLDTNPTAFYSSTQSTAVWIPTYELSDMFLFEYFAGYLAPLLCIAILYTICVCGWASIYFCCNTLSAYNKYKSVARSNANYETPMTSVCEGSSCWNKCGYFVDGFSIVTDFVLFTSVLLYSSTAHHKRLWLIAGYLSVVASLFGVLFYFCKLKMLTIFYPHIVLWRSEIECEYQCILGGKQMRRVSEKRKASKWNVIQHKTRKISLFLKYLVMYDLFSASLQDSLQSVVILSVFMNLERGDEDMEYNERITDTNVTDWSVFEWVLHIKLWMCFVFMFYKLVNAMSVECKCHDERIHNKRYIKPQHIVYINTKDNTMDINEYGHYHSIQDVRDTDNESEDGVEYETKYEEEPDELKQLVVATPRHVRQWSNISTGAVTLNVVAVDQEDRSTVNADVEQNGAQYVEMVPSNSNKNTQTAEDDAEDAKCANEPEIHQMNGVLLDVVTKKRQRPLSMSRTKSQTSLKSERIHHHQVMSENNDQSPTTIQCDDDGCDLLNGTEDSDSVEYDTD